jgi:DNA repair protein RecO (recombination protein O)
MWESTRAWVLTHRAYGDKGMILHCLTDRFGRQSYYLPSIRSRNSPIRPSMVLPLTPLALVARHRGKEQLERIKEARLLWHPKSLHQHPIKAAVCLYLAEFIDRIFTEVQEQITLWDFVEEHLIQYDESTQENLHFPLWFSVHLLSFSGLALPQQRKLGSFFDWHEAVWKVQESESSLNLQTSALLADLLQHSWPEAASLKSQGEQRRQLMDGLARFLEWHVPGHRTLKSVEVLRMYLGGV